MNETWWIKEEQLDEDQKAFASLGPNGSHLLIGPPGSGKTNLVLLRAKYMYLAGLQNILVIVFTKTLQEFITQGSIAYDLPDDVVQTMHTWQHNFLRQFGKKVEPQGDFDEKREFMANEIAGLVRSKKMSGIYDAIFLDEAHDYLPGEIKTFGQLGKVITAASDIHQKIYAGDPMDEIRRIVDQEHMLRYHYRLGQKICRLADGIETNIDGYVPLVPTSNYNEVARPSSVEVTECSSIEKQVEKVLEKLDVQLKAYPDELIGILCPKVEELEKVWEMVSNSSFGSLAMKQGGGDHSSYDDSKRIHVGTIHSAKGVEFRAAHLTSMESVKRFPYERNMVYTAVTRAKTSLSLYHTRPLPGYLQKSLKNLEPLPPLPRMRELFGKQGKS